MKILSGTVGIIKRKLRTALAEELKIDDRTGFDIEVVPEDNCDGSKPTLTLRIISVTRKSKKKSLVLPTMPACEGA
jgi:hypothetical protein